MATKKKGNDTNEKMNGKNARGRVTGQFSGAKIALATGLQARTSPIRVYSTWPRIYL